MVSKWAYSKLSVVDVYMPGCFYVESGICMITHTSAVCDESAVFMSDMMIVLCVIVEYGCAD